LGSREQGVRLSIFEESGNEWVKSERQKP